LTNELAQKLSEDAITRVTQEWKKDAN